MLSPFDHSNNFGGAAAMADSIFSSSSAAAAAAAAAAIVPDQPQHQHQQHCSSNSSSGGAELMCRVCHRSGSDVRILGCGCTLHAVSGLQQSIIYRVEHVALVGLALLHPEKFQFYFYVSLAFVFGKKTKTC